MVEGEVLDLKLSERLLDLIIDEKISFEKKKGKMDYLIRIGADVNADLGCNSMLVYAQELGDEELVKYLKEKGGVEFRISKEKRDELGKQFWDESGAIKSVEEIKELIMKGADLCAQNEDGYQIWKSLNLRKMSEILKDLPKGYIIDGGVDLGSMELTELPDFSNVVVCGNFYCGWNQLTTLEGAPRVVGESFLSSNNQLSSLKGAPEKVGGDFDVNDNKLATLKGAPEVVGRDFLCDRNMLYSLEGAPKSIGGDFWCSWNNLTSLKGAPIRVDGNFHCEGNSLMSLEGSPNSIGGDFDCRKNKLISLKGKPEKLGGEIKIDEEVLRKVEKEKRIKSILERMFAKREV